MHIIRWLRSIRVASLPVQPQRRKQRAFKIAKQAVANASDIREDKVAELKTKVDSGNYQVDAGDFASKLLEKYNELY